jgi:hypothetical protein
MREILLVGAYCDTDVKLAALERLLEQAKTLNLPILIFGRYPLPERIQRLCDYWIFDRSNPIIEDHVLSYWQLAHGRIISSLFLDYGFAALDQMTKSVGFVNSLGYDIAYWLVYDVDLEKFAEFRAKSLDLISSNEAHIVGFSFKPSSQGLPRGIDTTTLALKVNESSARLKGSLTENLYRRIIKTDQNLLAEDVLAECLDISELKTSILDQSLNLPATLTSTGIRNHGNVNDQFPKTYPHLSNCFVGRHEHTGKAVCFIWNIKTPGLNLVLDFGLQENLIISCEFDHIEFELAEIPTRCRVVSINEEPIDETLDAEYPEQYWGVNLIRPA